MTALLWSGGVLVVIVLLCAIVWTRNVKVIVPTGYRGLIRVAVDPNAADPKWGFFKIVVTIPASGELALPSLDVLRRMHHQEAVFSDGTPLPLALPGDAVKGVAFHVMNVPPTAQEYYFVGTREELAAFLKENHDWLYRVP